MSRIARGHPGHGIRAATRPGLAAVVVLAMGAVIAGARGQAAFLDGGTTTSAPRDPGPSPTLGAPPPRGVGGKTAVLHAGGAWTGWHQRDGEPSRWVAREDGSVLVRDGDAITDFQCGDFQLHLEFLCPLMEGKTGQARANSGVYLHGRYEVQVLDSYGLEPGTGDCGALYSIAPPLVNASRPPGEWQTFDIVFRAPRFDAEGTVQTSPFVTVLHNGVVIHNNVELPHGTLGGLDRGLAPSGPLLLQDHGDPVRYRNIWIRPLE